MKKQLIRLTEQDLHRIVKESVNRVLREWDEDPIFDFGDNDDIYNDMWDMYWSQSPKKNMAVYEKYKGNPQLIKKWFEMHNIDVNDFL